MARWPQRGNRKRGAGGGGEATSGVSSQAPGPSCCSLSLTLTPRVFQASLPTWAETAQPVGWQTCRDSGWGCTRPGCIKGIQHPCTDGPSVAHVEHPRPALGSGFAVCASERVGVL